MSRDANTGLNSAAGNLSGAQADIAIVGAGLSGALTALKYSLAHPEAKLLLLEARPANTTPARTWTFLESDLSEESLAWVRPLITRSWQGIDLKFPKFERSLGVTVCAFQSEDLSRFVTESLGSSYVNGAPVAKITEQEVELENGATIEAKMVLDARGFEGQEAAPKINGFHKFMSFLLELETPHDLDEKIYVDFTTPQLDGLRYFEILPWDATKVMIREAYYSDRPELHRERVRKSVQAYAERRGWKIARVAREETAVLALPMTSEYLHVPQDGEALSIGARGGYFHAMLGYAFADAVRMAEFLSSLPEPTTKSAREALTKFKRPWLSRQKFYRLLNRTLFHATEPALRHTIVQHVFEQTEPVIERLSAGQSSWTDRVRLLGGNNPVPLQVSLFGLSESSIR